jgi:hypothetical protein
MMQMNKILRLSVGAGLPRPAPIMNFNKIIWYTKRERMESSKEKSMPKHLTLELSQEQRAELVKHRNTDPLPYLRERCAAMLKIADGMTAAAVARAGLLRRYDPDAIYEWRRRYLAQGLPGLRIQAGRGRKPAFSPSASSH